MKKFAVIGNPINHSLSPLMHESIFKQIGLKASYEKIQIIIPTGQHQNLSTYFQA